MEEYFVDLHIHIGRARSGRAVKITGAKSLTFSNIIRHARDYKGLNMIGVIDSHSPEVLDEMEELLKAGGAGTSRGWTELWRDECDPWFRA